MTMTQTQWDELYTATYKLYEQAVFKDEYVRSTIGEVLDHLILVNPRNTKN